MTLQQLRYLSAIAQNGLSITAAAQQLRTSQPAISKQIKQLERELGFSIFARNARSLAEITVPGRQVLEHAVRILREAQSVKSLSDEFKHRSHSTFSIGTTHTQARYVLPAVIERFIARHPKVELHLHQGTSEQIAEMARLGHVNVSMATGSRELFPQYALLPCYQWRRQVVVPRSHALASVTRLSLRQLADFPIVSYVFSFSGPDSLQEQFANEGLPLNVALSAQDSDVIKTYVRLGLGVGIVASVALDPNLDGDLVQIDTSHLFPPLTTWLGITRGEYLSRLSLDFIHLVAPHLSRTLVLQATEYDSTTQLDTLFGQLQLPMR